MSGVALHLGDCLTLLRTVEAGSVDAVITDPPYGRTAAAWDTAVDWPTWWAEIWRVTKPTAVIAMFAMQPFATDLINSWRAGFRYDLICEKAMPVGFLDCHRKPLRTHEHILIFCRQFGGSTYNPQMTAGPRHKRGGKGLATALYSAHEHGALTYSDEYYPRSVLKFGWLSRNRPHHPTEKPLDLVEWLVRTYTQPGDRVLDPFMGRATTCEACLRNGRRSIGIEKNPGYFAMAQARISAAQATALT